MKKTKKIKLSVSLEWKGKEELPVKMIIGDKLSVKVNYKEIFNLTILGKEKIKIWLN